jgi:hypothetical protein
VFGKRRVEPNHRKNLGVGKEFRQKANRGGNKINLALDSAEAEANPEGKPPELAFSWMIGAFFSLAPAHALREEYSGQAKEAGIGLNSSSEENQG